MLEQSEASKPRTCHPERAKRRGISKLYAPVMLERSEPTVDARGLAKKPKGLKSSIQSLKKIPIKRFIKKKRYFCNVFNFRASYK